MERITWTSSTGPWDGTVNGRRLFSIHRSDRSGCWVLGTTLPFRLDEERAAGQDPKALTPYAEDVLTAFVESLGAEWHTGEVGIVADANNPDHPMWNGYYGQIKLPGSTWRTVAKDADAREAFKGLARTMKEHGVTFREMGDRMDAMLADGDAILTAPDGTEFRVIANFF